jgi:putative oxidoreductase
MKHNDGMHDLALLVARTALGSSIAAHGAQKLFGWFGGPGMDSASQMMQSLGFQPGDRYARLASLSEIGAGALIATGTGGPLGPALLLGVMGTAAGSVHVKNGYWQSNGGYELNAMYALLALLLAVEDHGRFSFDHASGVRRHMRPWMGWLALAAGAAGAAMTLSRRTASPQMETQQQPAASEQGTIESSGLTPVERSS